MRFLAVLLFVLPLSTFVVEAVKKTIGKYRENKVTDILSGVQVWIVAAWLAVSVLVGIYLTCRPFAGA